MEQKVIDAVKSCLSGEREKIEVTLDSNLREGLGYDSLDTMLLITELETVFDINIDEDAFVSIVTVGDIVEKIGGAINA